jgi:hypothetical protein
MSPNFSAGLRSTLPAALSHQLVYATRPVAACVRRCAARVVPNGISLGSLTTKASPEWGARVRASADGADQPDGSLVGEFAYQDDDEARFRAIPA